MYTCTCTCKLHVHCRQIEEIEWPTFNHTRLHVNVLTDITHVPINYMNQVICMDTCNIKKIITVNRKFTGGNGSSHERDTTGFIQVNTVVLSIQT